MELLSKDMILAATDLKREDVAVPEWGGTVRVSEMSGEAYADFVNAAFPEGDEGKKLTAKRFAATLVAFCVVDESGEQVFSADDVQALAKKSRTALERVFKVADVLNCITEKAIKAAEKN